MLAGYYDDSADNQTFLVAGLVAQVPRWKGFTDEWQDKLDASPSIDYYKASEARLAPEKRRNNNQFRDLSLEATLEKETLLAKVIVKYAEYSVYSSLDRGAFANVVLPRVSKRKHGFGRYVGHEYHFPFHGCIEATVDHLIKARVQDQVDFFFDEQGKVGKWARDMYDILKSKTATKKMLLYLGDCVPHDDLKMIALQSADLFASRIRRWDEGVVKDPVLAILSRIPCKRKRWSRAQIERWTARVLPDDQATR